MSRRRFTVCLLTLACCVHLLWQANIPSAPAQPPPDDARKLFARENLIAWCIVPFDSKKRGPEERAAMLQRLGFKRFAYDWRAEHVASFDAEMEALEKHGIRLEAFWFPATLNQDARTILNLLKRRHIKTQLWVALADPAPQTKDQAEKVAAAARALRPIAEEAAKIGCTVGLYNHGGWFGEPENQLAILEQLQLPNVGIVYNLHHGHDHLERFPEFLRKMRPHLLALNLNGMAKDGDKHGKKLLPLGQGDLDLTLLKTIRDSGYTGPFGILGHTQDDAEDRLRDNLDGLAYLVARLDGKEPGPRPKPRTYREVGSSRVAPAGSTGWTAEGRAEYRTPPLTVECQARLNGKNGYNILVACDTKKSGSHWELFSMAGTGRLTAYLPGMRPDHVSSGVDICDGRQHLIAMQREPLRVRLYLDGKLVADQAVEGAGKAALPGPLAFGRLVEGGLGCDGTLAWVRLSRGVREVKPASGGPPPADAQTIGLWQFEGADQARVEDHSANQNPAKRSPSQVPTEAAVVPAGNHLVPADKRLRAVLLDRSERDAYLAVKADSSGRLFVGGREAVFVFEPVPGGGYAKRELLHFPPDSIIIGLELRGNDLYVLAAHALYVVPEGRVRREGLKPRRLVWGLPLDLHVSFHCLAWGPEGDLYLDHGDPLLNYGDWGRPDHWGHWTLFTQPEGTQVPYNGVGSVLRVRPDGSGLQVVAGGFRGPVGLAFDRAWNLFTNDNDHESRADQYSPARLMQVTPRIDFAWPRGWMASMSPDRADLVEPMTAALGRGVPCDLAYYEDPLLPEAYRRGLLMCRWDRMAVTHYPLRPRGASFTTEENVFASGEHQARPVGITVGRGGRVFVTSLYLAGNVVSPYCVSDLVMLTPAADPPDHPYQPYDLVKVDDERLWEDLSCPSWERRARAHGELLRREGKLLEEAGRRLARVKDDDPALLHLPWLAGAGGSAEAGPLLGALAGHSRAEVRLQAVRVLAEWPRLQASREPFLRGLADTDAHVRLAALVAFFKAGEPLPLDAVAQLAGDGDSYLRQTAARLLAERATHADLQKLLQSREAPVRLAGALATGLRLTVPPVHGRPPDQLSLFYPADNAFFHARLRFLDGDREVDLRDVSRVGSYTTAEWWKAVRPTAEQQELFQLLVHALDDPAPAVQSQAAYFLSLLHDPRAEPLVAKARRSVQIRAVSAEPWRAVPRLWVAGPFPESPAADHLPEEGLIDLTAAYDTPAGKVHWREAAADAGRYDGKALPAPRKGQTWYGYFRLQSRHRQPAVLRVATEDTVQVWQNGRRVEDPAPAPDHATDLLLDVQPGSNDLLIRVSAGQPGRPLHLSFRARGSLTAALPERLDSSLLAQRLREGSGSESIAPEFLNVDWIGEVQRGDAAGGRKLFGSLGCVKCHAITAQQKGGGAPSLAEARKRFTVPYLVESILLPSKQIAEPFRGTHLALMNGQVVAGLVVNESAESLDVLLPDASRRTIPKKEIEDRTASDVSPMPAGLVRTPRELRDLLAYLLSENPRPP